MDLNEKVTEIVYQAVDNLNQMSLADQAIEKSPSTVLLGQKTKIDSMLIVSLLVAVEERLQDDFDTELSIADPAALSAEDSPFQTLGSLVSYIVTMLGEKGYA